MTKEISWKQFQFIMEVQTALVTNAINVSLDEDAREMRHIFSATGTLIKMDDAFYAAERIPSYMTAHEAANEFVGFACENLRNGEKPLPAWFSRG